MDHCLRSQNVATSHLRVQVRKNILQCDRLRRLRRLQVVAEVVLRYQLLSRSGKISRMQPSKRKVLTADNALRALIAMLFLSKNIPHNNLGLPHKLRQSNRKLSFIHNFRNKNQVLSARLSLHHDSVLILPGQQVQPGCLVWPVRLAICDHRLYLLIHRRRVRTRQPCACQHQLHQAQLPPQ